MCFAGANRNDLAMREWDQRAAEIAMAPCMVTLSVMAEYCLSTLVKGGAMVHGRGDIICE